MSNKPTKKVFIEKYVLRFYFLYSTILLIATVAQNNPPRISVTFYSIQIVYILGVWIFEKYRNHKNFYTPFFAEMSPVSYESAALFTLFTFKALFRSLFLDGDSILYLIDILLFVIIVVTLLMSYQSRLMLDEEYGIRQRRIELLFKKAKLSTQEKETVTPLLEADAARHQKAPALWRSFRWIIVVIFIGATLDTFASEIVNAIEQVVPLHNIFPPY